MTAKLPDSAFAFYVALGAERSYLTVAQKFGVDKKTVTRRAAQDDWQGRLERIEADARAKADDRMVEDLEGMNRRHLQTLRVIQRRALETLRALPLTTAMDAVRSLDLSIKQERVIRGEPSERTAVSIEDTIRREYARWMSGDAEDDGEEEQSDPDPVGATHPEDVEAAEDDGAG